MLIPTRFKLLSSSLVLHPRVGGYAFFHHVSQLKANQLLFWLHAQPPFGDIDDRIRYIAKALGLRTVIWQYDSNDWRANTGNITAATVDANYQALIQMVQNGTFASVCIPCSPLNSTCANATLYQPGWHDHAYPRAQQLHDGRSCQFLSTA